MEYLDFGELSMPKIGLGVYSMHGATLEKAVICACQNGCRWIDTAYRYENELELGRILHNGFFADRSMSISSKLSGLQYCGRKKRLYLDKKSARSALKSACGKLQKETLDMYMLHSPFHSFANAYQELIKLQVKGRCGIIGVSGFNESQLETVKLQCGVYPQFDMIEFHPFFSQPSLVRFCKSNNLQIIARSPFAHGEILSELNRDTQLVIMSGKYHKTIPQLVLRWITQQNVAVVFRSSNEGHIKENCNIFDFSLTDDEMEYFNSLNKNCSYGVLPSKGK